MSKIGNNVHNIKKQSNYFSKTGKIGYVPNSSSAPRALGTAHVAILQSEVEQEQRPNGKGDREAIVVGAGLCNGEGERAKTGYATHWVGKA